MKAIRILTILLFCMIVAVPVAAFNWEKDAVSLIDNRKLTPNPLIYQDTASEESEEVDDEGNEEDEEFVSDAVIAYVVIKNEDTVKKTVYPSYTYEAAHAAMSTGLTGDLTNDIENFLNDRIGFRDDMILAYTVLNDRLFGKMVHPSYVYGQNGYVFGAGLWVNEPYTEYHEAFADMVKEVQDFCEARNVPFLFVFEPAKPAVLEEYLPVGMNYDREWVDSFLAALDERGVRYVDTTTVLKEKTEAGEVVFNQKYNANHWNDLGAYYGTREMLKEMRKSIPAVHVTELEELQISEVLQTSLPASEYPIHEMEPIISIKDMEVEAETGQYVNELYRHPSYTGYGYYVNEKRKAEGAPKALVFQGSYMNGMGYKFFQNAFGEYIYVHDYQNILDFQYYYSIFRPDCVIFEVAEYTLSDGYFGFSRMKEMDLSPTRKQVRREDARNEVVVLKDEKITAEPGEQLITVIWDGGPEEADYAWLVLDEDYDMYRTARGFEVTLPTEVYLEYFTE